ncbi:hypothetical protein BVAVS116_H0077 (plasmid) [Borreliella valaisiana VS116]|uniref:Uncharacterized protein n=1 Tax=Borreliella valaisiana VS116 TaxID=445987 RepID=C0R8Z2_BORVA|nr:hypothetical protein BVAVS116_H0077 [Borreliella valaisiana VS116]
MSFSKGFRKINTPRTSTVTKIITAISLISFKFIRSSVILISIFNSSF